MTTTTAKNNTVRFRPPNAVFARSSAKTYRADQVMGSGSTTAVTDFAEMTDVSLARQARRRREIKSRRTCSKQAGGQHLKWLLGMDSNAIETVFIPETSRGTCASRLESVAG